MGSKNRHDVLFPDDPHIRNIKSLKTKLILAVLILFNEFDITKKNCKKYGLIKKDFKIIETNDDTNMISIEKIVKIFSILSTRSNITIVR